MSGDESRPLVKVLGMALVVAAMVCAVGASVLAARVRPAFEAATLIKVTSPADDARLREAFRKAQEKFPERMQRPLKADVRLEPGPVPDFYRVTALAETPLASAEIANNLTRLMHEVLRGPGAEGEPAFMLLDAAQPPPAATRVRAKEILRWGLMLGIGCGAVGALLLAYTAARRERDEQGA